MSRTLIATAVALLLSGPALAQTEREHGVHVHGRGQINLAVDENHLELELTAPGMDIVGFEHAPREDSQRAAIDAALAILNNADNWLAFEPAGACTAGEIKAHTHGYAAGDGHDHHHDDKHGDHAHDHDHDEHGDPDHGHDKHDDHDGEHDHGHDHDDHEGHDHAEFHLRLRADCTRPPQAVQLRLAERFPGIELLRVDLITPTRQDRVELSSGQTRVRLDR